MATSELTGHLAHTAPILKYFLRSKGRGAFPGDGRHDPFGVSDQFSAERVDSSLLSQLARHSNVKYGLEPTPELETIVESNHETKARSDICSDRCGGADVSHRRIVGQRRWWPWRWPWRRSRWSWRRALCWSRMQGYNLKMIDMAEENTIGVVRPESICNPVSPRSMLVKSPPLMPIFRCMRQTDSSMHQFQRFTLGQYMLVNAVDYHSIEVEQENREKQMKRNKQLRKRTNRKVTTAPISTEVQIELARVANAIGVNQYEIVDHYLGHLWEIITEDELQRLRRKLDRTLHQSGRLEPNRRHIIRGGRIADNVRRVRGN